MERKREGKRKRNLHVAAMLLGLILTVGSAMAIEAENVTLGIGLWQMAWGLMLTAGGAYGVWLEETRACRYGKVLYW